MIWDIASEYGDINAIYNTLGNVCGATPVPNNLALNKPVTISSLEDAAKYPASAAVDNSYGSRWSSAFADPQWIYVDLGATYNVNRVKLTWEAAYASAYRIEVSNTAANDDWTVVKSVTNTTLTNDHTGLTTKGRYVRIYGTARATAYGYSLYALEVYGTPDTPTGNNLALNKTGTASSLEDATFPASLAFDGSTTTRWASTEGVDPQWIAVDLGAPYSINRIKLLWETAYGKSYTIAVSTNNADWNDVYSTTTGDGATDDLNITPTTGRYVRITGTARGTTYGYSLYEFEVYGTATTLVTSAASVEFYPNPAKESLTIGVKNATGQSRVSIVSTATGAQVYTSTVQTGEALNVNTSSWPKGIYIINLETGSEKKQERIIIEK
jgi:chitinase